MEFSLSLYNRQTTKYEMLQAIVTVAGLSRIFGDICGAQDEQRIQMLEAAVNGDMETFMINAGATGCGWQVDIKMLKKE